MNGVEVTSLLDDIYAAAVEPSLWAATLARFADALGGSGVWLSRLNVADGKGSGLISRIDPAMPQVYLDHFAAINPFANARDPASYLRNWTADVRLQDDWLPRDELLKTEFYNDFLRPQDIHSSLLVQLTVEGEETVVINVNRTHAAGGFGPKHVAFARKLRPHFARAFITSKKLAGVDVRHQETLQLLDAVNDAVFVVDSGGRIDHVNAAAHQVDERRLGLRVSCGRLEATDAVVAQRLNQMLGSAAAPAGTPRTGGTLSLGRTGALLSVMPIGTRISDVFGGDPRAIVVLSAAKTAGLKFDRLKARYGLTNAEARVALAIVSGSSPRETAEAFGVSFHTVRNQLQRLYSKTETRRQSELALLLARTSDPAATTP